MLLQHYFHLKIFSLVNTFSLTAVFDKINPLSTIPIKWSNTLKQFAGKLPTNCLRVFDHFVGLHIFMRHFNHTEFVTENLHQTLTSFCISFLLFFFHKQCWLFLTVDLIILDKLIKKTCSSAWEVKRFSQKLKYSNRFTIC